jgi:sigma-B regulation protein RsbU (phosphoserine phosphatase)
MEMNHAARDVQDNITSLSTSLNRSALAVGPDDADQVQVATAKARQFDQFFLRIARENEFVASYASTSTANDSCISPPGIWVSPTGSNQTLSERRDDTIKSLCAPFKIMKELHRAESSLLLSYIGTDDGILAVWPYSSKTLRNVAPFSYKDMPYYSEAKRMKKTIWTGPYVDGNGNDAITVTTPFYRGDDFAGIAGMDVSLYPIFGDLSSMKGRGSPFIIGSDGLILYRSASKPDSGLKDLFASDNLIESANPEVRALANGILRKSSGSIVVGLGKEDVYVAFSRIDSLGWTLCIVYAVEEMSLPARYIDSGIKEVASSATAGLDEAMRTVWNYFVVILVLTALAVLGTGWWLAARIEGQLDSFVYATERVSRGELDVEVSARGELAVLGASFNKMVRGLRGYVARQESAATVQGGSGKEIAFLQDVKRNLVPVALPQNDEYEIRALYWPSETSSFDLYDILEADDKIAIAMAGVGGDGVQAAMLAIMSRTLIRASPDKLDPARAVGGLNSQITQHGHGTNLAAFYAVLDPVEHKLEYVNAGFNPPFIVDPGGMVDTLGGGGVALGMLDRMKPETTSIPIQLGDVMVVYSNGVVEAEDEHKNQFGIARLINLVIKNRDRPASEILLTAEKDLLDHTKSKPAASDVILIIFKRR